MPSPFDRRSVFSRNCWQWLLNDSHNLIYSRILLMLISLYAPIPWPCLSVVSVLNHLLGGHKKLSNAEKKWKNWVLKIGSDLVFFSKALLVSMNKQGQAKTSPKAIDRSPCNLVCSIVYASTTKVLHIMTLGWPWPILRQGQIWSLRLLYELKTIAALGLKVAWSIQLNELMQSSEYQRSRSFFDLDQRSFRFQS